MVAMKRLELLTSRLWVMRSNQLSYIAILGCILCPSCWLPSTPKRHFLQKICILFKLTAITILLVATRDKKRALKKVWQTDKPGSVVDNHSSRRTIARTLKQPTRIERGPRHADAYLVLLRVEFTMPCTVASHAVRSYRTLSPLPMTWKSCDSHLSQRRSTLCCTGRQVTLPSR